MRRKVLAVIPARLGSSRFPGKVLFEFQGKPLLWYVWREIKKSKRIDRVIIATDSRKVFDCGNQFGAECFLSRQKHKTGSDRAAEVARKYEFDIIINVQADNFGLKGAVLDRVLQLFLKERKCESATLARRIDDDRDLFNPDIVKLVMDHEKQARWFSRYPIPYVRGIGERNRWQQFAFWEHIGVYLYSRNLLDRFSRMKPVQSEKAESLEQLRLLENGVSMRVYPIRSRTVAIDRPQDVKKMIAIY